MLVLATRLDDAGFRVRPLDERCRISTHTALLSPPPLPPPSLPLSVSLPGNEEGGGIEYQCKKWPHKRNWYAKEEKGHFLTLLCRKADNIASLHVFLL